MKVEIKEVMLFDRQRIYEYQVTNDYGFRVGVITLGATVTGIYAPDRKGALENVVLSYKDYNEYKINSEYMGSIIGRTAGRIGGGCFTLDGKQYGLNKNDNGNTLHGGDKGFNLKLWHCEPVIEHEEVKLIFTCESQHGEENYPGNLKVKVTYTISNNNLLKISYEAETDKTTLVNLTNHAYFNLSGEAKRKILAHSLYVDSNSFLELDEESIPTGEILEVENTPFDFTKPKEIGRDIEKSHPQLERCRGYDHPWILKKGKGPKVDLYEEESGRGMKIYTDCSSMVIYSTNFPKGKELSTGRISSFRDAVCFEAQNSPIGRENIFLDESILEAGETYKRETTFEFYVK